ncbi:MAG: rhodanese-like domain-containing protein [Cellulomonas sp.]
MLGGDDLGGKQHEHEQVPIPGALLVRRGDFLDGSALDALDRARPLILHCRSGARSTEVLPLVRAAGFDAMHLEDGILAWLATVGPVAPRK